MEHPLASASDILTLIRRDAWMMRVLAAVRALALPDAWVGAGFVRSAVWDALHAYEERTPLPDVDVIYLDTTNTDEAREKEYDAMLRVAQPDVGWSSKNQARMHLLHGHAPYASSTEALANWTETATAIAVRLCEDGRLELTAPHGVDDLLTLIVRPTSRDVIDTFRARVAGKHWLDRWPRLRVVEDVLDPRPPSILTRE